MKRCDPKTAIMELLNDKYKGADSIIWSGSVLRGQFSKHSDLDIVVLYSKIEKPYRESYYYKDWPIDAFINDIETLNYFFTELDGPSGYPVLMSLVKEGIVLPRATKISDASKQLADDILKAGPPELTLNQISMRRYLITDLLDDLKAPNDKSETLAISAELYAQISDFYLRANKKWSAKGKWLARRLFQEDKNLAAELHGAFEKINRSGITENLDSVIEKILKPFGGLLWDGYYLPGEKNWRKPIKDKA